MLNGLLLCYKNKEAISKEIADRKTNALCLLLHFIVLSDIILKYQTLFWGHFIHNSSVVYLSKEYYMEISLGCPSAIFTRKIRLLKSQGKSYLFYCLNYIALLQNFLVVEFTVAHWCDLERIVHLISLNKRKFCPKRRN